MFRIHMYCGTPTQRKPERPVFQPRDRGEVFWNTALLSIEQTSFLLLHEYGYKVSDITMNNIGTATLRHPQLLYASSRTTRSSGKTTGSGTTTMVVNSTPQGLAGTLILARTNRNHNKRNQIRHDLQTGMTRQVSTLNVLASSQ